MRRRVIALAGAFQAAALTKSIAYHGQADDDALVASINSIYSIDAATVEEVYGNIAGVRMGLAVLIEHFTARRRDLDHLRCVMTLLQLARKLDADPGLCRRLRDGVEAAKVHAQDPEASRDTALERLGKLYLDTISDLVPRVVVHGNPLYLQQPRFVGWIRAVLLSGVRAAVLWHQVGGSRLQLLFRGRAMVTTAHRLLEQLDA